MTRRGFTLIEASTVVVVLAVLAALIVPSLASQKRSLDARAAVAGMQRIVVQARERAVTRKATCTLRFEEASGRLVLEETPVMLDSQAADAGAVSDEPVEISEAILPDGFEARAFRTGEQDRNAGDWEVRFYHDGSCDGGGFEIASGTDSSSLVLYKDGTASWQDGALPAIETTKWPAGENEQRG